jgi:flagellar biosynthetic protein FliO
MMPDNCARICRMLLSVVLLFPIFATSVFGQASAAPEVKTENGSSPPATDSAAAKRSSSAQAPVAETSSSNHAPASDSATAKRSPFAQAPVAEPASSNYAPTPDSTAAKRSSSAKASVAEPASSNHAPASDSAAAKRSPSAKAPVAEPASSNYVPASDSAVATPSPSVQASAAEPASSNYAPASDSAAVKPGPSAQASAAEPASSNYDFPVLQTLGGFGLVISLIFIGVFLAKKFVPQYFGKNSGEKHLKVLESLPLGDKRSIALIQFDNKRFLVGNTTHQISLLSPASGFHSSASDSEVSSLANFNNVAGKTNGNSFRSLYEADKVNSPGNGSNGKIIPPDIRAKMRQLREALEK